MQLKNFQEISNKKRTAKNFQEISNKKRTAVLYRLKKIRNRTPFLLTNLSSEYWPSKSKLKTGNACRLFRHFCWNWEFLWKVSSSFCNKSSAYCIKLSKIQRIIPATKKQDTNYSYIYIYIFIYIYIYTYIYIYMYVCIYIYIHTYTWSVIFVYCK